MYFDSCYAQYSSCTYLIAFQFSSTSLTSEKYTQTPSGDHIHYFVIRLRSVVIYEQWVDRNYVKRKKKLVSCRVDCTKYMFTHHSHFSVAQCYWEKRSHFFVKCPFVDNKIKHPNKSYRSRYLSWWCFETYHSWVVLASDRSFNGVDIWVEARSKKESVWARWTSFENLPLIIPLNHGCSNLIVKSTPSMYGRWLGGPQ